jgi:outer membrane receptor protein involved in Fe transport
VSNFAYTGNGSAAKSEGVELSVSSMPVSGLKISAWGSYDKAVLTEDFVNVSNTTASAGDRLPNTPRFSGYFSLEQEFPLWSGATGFAGGAVSYVGDRRGVFRPTTVRQEFPAYAKTDLRAGLRVDTWTTTLFVNNVTDRRALIGGGIGYFNPAAYIYIQPRTYGVNLSKSF